MAESMSTGFKSTNHPRSIVVVSTRQDSRDSLAREFRMLGIEVRTASAATDAADAAQVLVAEAAVIDLQSCDDAELSSIAAVAAASPETKIAALLPYRSMALATRVGRLGATTSVEKPSCPAEILAAICGTRVSTTSVRDLFHVQQEHAKRTLAECRGNLSETARVLGIDRRTLRKLISDSDRD